MVDDIYYRLPLPKDRKSGRIGQHAIGFAEADSRCHTISDFLDKRGELPGEC
jgi:hypothetical protein